MQLGTRLVTVVPRAALVIAALLAAPGCTGKKDDAGVPDASAASDAAASDDGGARLTCPYEAQDCDGDPSNGCEALVSVDVANCGACGHACGGVHGKATCNRSLCAFACDPDYANCNGDDGDGCESHLPSDPLNCTHCHIECPYGANQLPSCTNGVCGTRCILDHLDCNGDISDGCEETVGSTTACGDCGHVCGKGPGGVASTCDAGACSFQCEANWAHCGTDDSSGCETNLVADAKNCGTCGNVCPATAPTCLNARCQQ